jgi:hypothetical protein
MDADRRAGHPAPLVTAGPAFLRQTPHTPGAGQSTRTSSISKKGASVRKALHRDYCVIS